MLIFKQNFKNRKVKFILNDLENNTSSETRRFKIYPHS